MPPLRAKRYLLTGLITFMPLWVTWLVFKFVLGLLADIGAPLIDLLVNSLGWMAPTAAHTLNQRWISFVLAMLLSLLALYLLGSLAHRVIGQRILHLFDRIIDRIPLVQTIYGGTKKLMTILQQKPGDTQRVVLVDFPRTGMKAVGFVTRTMPEQESGREIAAVYIPTTPNPTGGYLVLLPVDELTPTDWSMDQAMAFILSGGAVTTDTIRIPSDSSSPTLP